MKIAQQVLLGKRNRKHPAIKSRRDDGFLIPDIAIVIFDPVLLQDCQELRLKCPLAVVFGLSLNVGKRSRHLRNTDTEGVLWC